MYLDPCHEIDELTGAQRRLIAHLRRVAWRRNGYLRAIVPGFVDSGIVDRPHLVTEAPFDISIGNGGARRIHPTKETDRYIEFGAPYVLQAGTPTQVQLGAPTRSANMLRWQLQNADVRIAHGGHFVKLDIELLNGWRPPSGLFAFPVALSGLTYDGAGIVSADGTPVMHVRRPVVYDAAATWDVRPIAHSFEKIKSNWYAVFRLPDLTGMQRPVVDPTLEAQPDGTDGIDTQVYGGVPTGTGGTATQLYVRYITGQDWGTEPWMFAQSFLKFDLSELEGAASLDSASLFVCRYDSLTWWDNATVIHNHRMLTDWSEAAACWNVRDTGVNWPGDSGSDGGADAGGSQAGTDFDADELGSKTIGANNADAAGTQYEIVWSSMTELASMVSNNYGLNMYSTGQSENHAMCSSDHATAGYRPKLVVVYTAAGGGGGSPWYAYAQQ